jgi:hypothetical protein
VIFFPDISSIFLWKKIQKLQDTVRKGQSISHGQATGKLYHLRLRVECTLFVIYKAG